MKHILATERGIRTVVGLLQYMGAMCSTCGFGTRATSKNWAKCKQCGARVARRALPPIEPALVCVNCNQLKHEADPVCPDPKAPLAAHVYAELSE